MTRTPMRLISWIVFTLWVSAAFAGDRPADEILWDFEAVKRPVLDRETLKAPAAVGAYGESMRAYFAERSRLILELFRSHPENPKTPALLIERWQDPYLILNSKADDLIKEADDALAQIHDESINVEAFYLKARASTAKHRDDPSSALSAIELFLQAAPDDPRASVLLYKVARSERDEAKKTAIEDRILKDFPKSPYAESIKNARSQQEAVGKPFELEFSDAVNGLPVSMKGLKGKVVVVDFWATWCGPCVAEMPKMKKLYAEYHDKGVEFIGVSLDHPEDKGGLTALKDYVAKNGIAWPQYYQGNSWQSEFSTSWGVRAIPAVFVVDQEGKLYSIDARDKLETIIPELLKKNQKAEASPSRDLDIDIK